MKQLKLTSKDLNKTRYILTGIPYYSGYDTEAIWLLTEIDPDDYKVLNYLRYQLGIIKYGVDDLEYNGDSVSIHGVDCSGWIFNNCLAGYLNKVVGKEAIDNPDKFSEHVYVIPEKFNKVIADDPSSGSIPINYMEWVINNNGIFIRASMKYSEEDIESPGLLPTLLPVLNCI